jgi:inosine-uridine nucleoside N-ribohydrolase
MPAPTSSQPIPVILDTDIGTDIDDTWALAHLLRCPELDLKLVLTASGDMPFRAKVTAKFLEAAGRTDVPVGLGFAGETSEQYRNQEPWVRGYELKQYPGEIIEDGIDRMIRLIMESTETITVIGIAPAFNLAEALRREPAIAGRCRLVGMFGSFNVGYDGNPQPSAETNVRVSVESARLVLAAPWLDILITPLDTCGTTILTGELYHKIWSATDDPALRAIIENYCVFAPRVSWMHCDYFALRSTVLFDCVAVYLAYAEDLVEVENIRYRISDDGMTIADPNGDCSARVALRWKNEPAFFDHLTDRLLGLALKGQA